MLIAFLHFLANLIIALVLLRLLQAKVVDYFGEDSPTARALAFID